MGPGAIAHQAQQCFLREVLDVVFFRATREKTRQRPIVLIEKRLEARTACIQSAGRRRVRLLICAI
jgi:hypothetical protein